MGFSCLKSLRDILSLVNLLHSWLSLMMSGLYARLESALSKFLLDFLSLWLSLVENSFQYLFLPHVIELIYSSNVKRAIDILSNRFTLSRIYWMLLQSLIGSKSDSLILRTLNSMLDFFLRCNQLWSILSTWSAIFENLCILGIFRLDWLSFWIIWSIWLNILWRLWLAKIGTRPSMWVSISALGPNRELSWFFGNFGTECRFIWE
jgi:hypothetical protein